MEHYQPLILAAETSEEIAANVRRALWAVINKTGPNHKVILTWVLNTTPPPHRPTAAPPPPRRHPAATPPPHHQPTTPPTPLKWMAHALWGATALSVGSGVPLSEREAAVLVNQLQCDGSNDSTSEYSDVCACESSGFKTAETCVRILCGQPVVQDALVVAIMDHEGLGRHSYR